MTIEWVKPWVPISDPGHRAKIEEELHREVGDGHALFGLAPTAIARREDQDDVLFLLDDERVAEVHLTWTGRSEANAQWPCTTIYPSIKECHSGLRKKEQGG